MGVFDRRCQAGVVGGIIIAMLVFSIILPLILYYQRMAEYNTAQAEIGIKYLEEQAREMLNVRALSLDEVTPSLDCPVIEAVNVGSIPVTLKRIWLIKSSKVDMLIDLSEIDLIDLALNGENLTGGEVPTLQPGYTLRITVKIISLEDAENYVFYLESDRGILHPRRGVQPLIPSESEEFPENLSEILGPTFLDFFSFRWYLYDGRSLTPWPYGYESFTIPTGSTVAFGVYVCNKDPLKRTIRLDEYTHMWMYYSGSGGELKKSEFYIVGVDPYGGVYPYDPNNPITIDYDQVALLVFAAKDPGSARGNNVPSSGGVGYTNLLIHGFVDDLPFSQNVPFVGITFT
jgi:hypothetical protein